jgi:hypothetical protein
MGNDEWLHNPANPKVQEALESTFEIRLTGLELQCVGSALDALASGIMHDLTSGHVPDGLKAAAEQAGVPLAEAMVAGMRAAQCASGIAGNLHKQWVDYVEGRKVSISDMPPDPFRGEAAGPYL